MTHTLSLSARLAIEMAEQHATLHFGLGWTPLIGSRPARLARQRAVAARASHYIYCGERGVALALASITGAPGRWRQFSAAAVFAGCHPAGAVLWMAPLPDGRYWLVGARDGAVLTRTDRIYESWAHIKEAVDQLVMDYPGLSVLLPQDWPPEDLVAVADPTGQDGDTVSLGAVLACMLDRATPMQALSWFSRARARWWIIAVLIGADVAASFVDGSKGVDENNVLAAEDVPFSALDHEQARQRTLQDLVQSGWGGADNYMPVLAELRALPVVLDGWRISGAQCDWSVSAWTCRADYRREDAAATNLGLLRSVPGNRQVHFTPFSVGHVSWTIPGEPAPLAIDNFPDSAWVDTSLVSALQTRAPAFVHMTLGPRVDMQQESVPQPSLGLPDEHPVVRAPGRRSLTIQGPFRSFGVLNGLAAHVAWDQVVLQFQQGITPGLSHSALQIALKGWVHEK